MREFDAALGQNPAIRIFEVLPDSPAEKAGLKTGDLILSLAGEPVEDSSSFATAIASKSGPTELEILRNDQRITVTVQLKAVTAK
jgi:S1-C subfamily serine protease